MVIKRLMCYGGKTFHSLTINFSLTIDISSHKHNSMIINYLKYLIMHYKLKAKSKKKKYQQILGNINTNTNMYV